MDAMLEDVSGKPAEDSTTLSENRIFQLAEVIRESTESDSVLICEGEGGRSLGKESTSNSDFTRANSRFHAIRCIGAPVDEEYVCAATKALFAAKRSSGAPSNRYVVSCRSVTRELSDLGTPTVPPGGITPAGIAVIHSASLELIFVRKECEMKEKWVVRHGHEESKNHYKRLQPRASFAAYRRSISGCSQEWSLQDMQVLFLAHQRLMALLEMQHSDTLKRFLATMSHELRTPFSGLMGILDILMLDDSLHGQAHDLLRVARSSAGQMLNILDDILTVCKLGEDSVILNVGPFQLWEPTRQAHSLFVARARSDSVTLTKIEEVIGGMDLEKDKGLLGDHRKILQACINLLGNAFKFLWKGESGPGHVQLKSAILPSLQALVGVVREDRRRFDAATNEVEELDRILTENFAALVGNQACDGSPKGTGQRVWLLVSVEDNGIGISARDIKRLGEPFKQVHDGAKRPVGGTGLGLHISRRFVEIMGGCLWAFSTSGVPEENCSNRGTMVQFAVPLEPVETGKEAPQHVSRTQEMREEPSKLGGRLSAASIPPPIIAESAVYSEHQEAVKRKAESPGASSKKQAKLEISPTMVKTPEMKAALSQDRPVILIADDNRTNLLVLSKMLKDLAPFLYCMSVSSGFAMVQAHESFAAENGKESQLALIITDFHMPNLDGIEALEIIRKRDPSTPAFVVTADVFLSSERLSQCQPVEVLMKPFSRDTLARALEKHIAQYRAVQ
uniref:histidine kinase n=1 Tax=Pinguiococcus pyrenoidosus TaxID=172671 RepID=A0A7R9U4W0_9STRA